VKITRIFADEHGGSHFADAEIPLASATLFPQLPPFQFTRLSAPSGIKLFVVPAELSVFDLHTAPERQLAVSLNGTVEYETSDGDIRRFAAGDIVLVEDTTGRGHITRFADGAQGFFHIPVPDDWPPA
jgi:hypothetical protein